MKNTYSKFSFKNKNTLLASQKAGCYYCMNTFDTKDIKEWVDNGETAVCPHCNVDSVVPYKENNFKALLSTLNKENF